MGEALLLRPWWLAALLPVVLAGLWVWRRRLAGDWAGVVEPELMAVLQRLGWMTRGGKGRRFILPFLAAAVLALALTGPALLRPGAVTLRALDPLVLVIDLSPSVVADDKVLGQVQAAASTLLDTADGRPVGLMVYAADAFLASAPTTEVETIRELVGVLGRDTMPVVGSRPDIALSMARDLFSGGEGPGIGGADLVVISDGGGTGPRATEEAARLVHDGARVWALALPQAAEGAPAPAPEGLAQMAQSGGGAALPAAQAADLQTQIAARRTALLVQDPQAGTAFHDFGPWLLPLAMAALFPLFQRRR